MLNNVTQKSVVSYLPPPSVVNPLQSGAINPTVILSSTPSTLGQGNNDCLSLQSRLGDKQDLTTLGRKLDEIATRLGVNVSAPALLTALNTTTMALHPDSSYPTQSRVNVTLATFIQSQGLPLPNGHFSLTGLAHAVSHRAMEHPLGGFNGALAWPIPLSANEQRRLRAFTLDHTHHVGASPSVALTQGGILEFLRYQNAVPAATLEDPIQLLNALLGSPEAQRMGKTLQEHMQGAPTPDSAADYLLAAVTLSMDPESISTPDRNKVAGFDLASPEHYGRPASAVVERLTQHLGSEGKTSLEMAGAGAYLLLAGRAPAFLIKDLPDSVTYGSPAWLNLAVAAATIDAQTPGKVANMTFAQVMLEARSASVADPSVTERAQREALLDWGVANGVIPKKDEALYTADELTSLINQYNERIRQMADASAAMDAPLPSRNALALAELKKRFGDLGELFEQKLIDVRYRVPWLDDGQSYREDDANPHSLLDIAMMDLADPYVDYTSTDPRIPVAALNANRRFGVTQVFDRQFADVIQAKKNAIATYIKHLTSQLPLEDRKNLEYEALGLYLRPFYKSSTEGTGLEQYQKFLIKTQRNGEATAYEVDFNQGTISRTYPGLAKRRRGSSLPVDLLATHKFVPVGSETFERKTRPAGEALPDSFSTPRTQLIADAFVKHLDLDTPEIRQQALGLTTLDRHERKIDAIKEFLFDLVPFRSAIVNFQKGNYGAGTVDLGLDLFGFLTAGAGAAGKILKVGGTALSAMGKATNIVKIIGAATLTALNPLGGVGDLAVGGARFAAKGTHFLTSKGVKSIRKLRGAASSYDVLKAASKQHTLAATGTYQIASQSVQGGAVLKEGKWYAFDVEKMQPYGAPLQRFVPEAVAQDGAVKGLLDKHLLSWLATVVAPSPPTKDLPLVFQKTISQAKAIDEVAYLRGYSSGKPDAIPGYFPGMNLEQLKELSVDIHRTPEQLGSLYRAIEKKRIEISLNNSKIFSDEVSAAGGTLTPMPQGFYLSQTDVLSEGECAVLANAMALAIENHKSDTLIGNFFTAIADLNNPKSIKFRQDLSRFQGILENQVHGLQTPRQAGYQTIIDELANARSPKKLLIRDRGHVVLAGMSVQNNSRQWFYYDPNFGLVKFPTERAMRTGLENALSSGRSNVLMQPYGADRAKPEYKYAEFNELELMNSTRSVTSLHGLFDTAI